MTSLIPANISLRHSSSKYPTRGIFICLDFLFKIIWFNVSGLSVISLVSIVWGSSPFVTFSIFTSSSGSGLEIVDFLSSFGGDWSVSRLKVTLLASLLCLTA